MDPILYLIHGHLNYFDNLKLTKGRRCANSLSYICLVYAGYLPCLVENANCSLCTDFFEIVTVGHITFLY